MTRTQYKAKTAVRLALGAIFTVFGLNGFLHFIPSLRLPAWWPCSSVA